MTETKETVQNPAKVHCTDGTQTKAPESSISVEERSEKENFENELVSALTGKLPDKGLVRFLKKNAWTEKFQKSEQVLLSAIKQFSRRLKPKTLMNEPEDIAPSSEDIFISDLIIYFKGYISEHCELPEEDLLVISYWCLATWFYEDIERAPYILLLSKMPGSGKSAILKTCANLSFNPYMGAGSSPASLWRLTDQAPRTIFIDEVDMTKVDSSKELGQFLNSGIDPDGVISRCDQNSPNEVLSHRTFALKMLSGLDSPSLNLASATLTRCIIIWTSESRQRKKHVPSINKDDYARKLRSYGAKVAREYSQQYKSQTVDVNVLSWRTLDTWEAIFILSSLVDQENQRMGKTSNDFDTLLNLAQKKSREAPDSAVEFKILLMTKNVLTRALTSFPETYQDNRYKIYSGYEFEERVKIPDQRRSRADERKYGIKGLYIYGSPSNPIVRGPELMAALIDLKDNSPVTAYKEKGMPYVVFVRIIENLGFSEADQRISNVRGYSLFKINEKIQERLKESLPMPGLMS